MDERNDFLDQACAEIPSLRAQVDRLLVSHDKVAVALILLSVNRYQLFLSTRGTWLALFGAITVQKNTRDLHQLMPPKQITKNADF